MSTELDRDGIAREFAIGFCDGGDAGTFFSQGMRVRVDTTVDGNARVAGVLIDRCPAAAAMN
jgi:hypothetical protein